MISIMEVGTAGDVAVGKGMDVDSTIGAFVVMQAVRIKSKVAMNFFMLLFYHCEEGGNAIASKSRRLRSIL